MHDSNLIEALGWDPCVINVDDPQWCVKHDAVIYNENLCTEMVDSLDHAEQGMDLILPILKGLIAELWVPPYAVTEPKPRSVSRALDRAEAKLRELTGNP